MSTSDQFRKVAVLALRLMAVVVLMFAARSTIYAMLWNGSELGMLGRVNGIMQGGGGIALWLLSAPLGRAVSAGLDDARAD